MSTAAELREQFFSGHLKALNRLVFAAEALEAPTLPDVPDWEKSPAGLEVLGEETRTPEELLKTGIEWQHFATKLHDLLEKVVSPEDGGDLENLIADVRAKAKEARLALIAIETYDPPEPGSP